MKRFLAMLLVAATLVSLLFLCGCGEKKLLHCDRCGLEIKVDADSNMEEGWIIYCGECEEELFGDNPVVQEGDIPFQ